MFILEVEGKQEEKMEWFFDGFGTEIISSLISLIVGGVAGYKIGVKRTSKQKQVAGDKAKQRQILNIDRESIKDDEDTKKKENTRIVQSQKAGDDSSQKQVGGINIVRK